MTYINAMTIRYMGSNHARFVIQRGDKAFWTGKKWSRILDMARVFFDHKAAQAAYRGIQRRRFRGKPVRRYHVNVVITLTGDDVDDVTNNKLIDFMANALRIDIATLEYGEGPLENVALEASMKFATLCEVSPKS
ncbi:hypothetical protein BH11PLA2_BH11PLA2_16080 [soil metagenome]